MKGKKGGRRGVVGIQERGSKRERKREKDSASEPKRRKGKQMKSDTLIQRASSA